MSIWLQEKYISLISHRLPLFKKINGGYAFRCPICGDSKKHESKTRGGFYIPPSSQTYNMGCFNCGASMILPKFLKLFDKSVYDAYQLEEYAERHVDREPASAVVVQQPKKPRLNMDGLVRYDKLPDDHPALKYVINRGIPESKYRRLYYCPAYYTWLHPDKKCSSDHPRLILPFFDRFGNITRTAARAFGNEEPRYLYHVINPVSTRIFGLDEIDPMKEVMAVEGPIDSLFLPNAIAVGGASYQAPELKDIKNKIIIPDNQPRNRSVCDQIEKCIDRGDRVCLWQQETSKDINDMIRVDKYSIDDVIRLIRESTFQGIEAKLQFSRWVKY